MATAYCTPPDGSRSTPAGDPAPTTELALGTATRSAFARLKAHSRHQPTNARGAHAACRYTRTMTLSDTITIAIPALPLHTSHREPRSLGRPWPGQSQASAARNRAQRHPRDRDRPRDHLILTQPGLLKDPGWFCCGSDPRTQRNSAVHRHDTERQRRISRVWEPALIARSRTLVRQRRVVLVAVARQAVEIRRMRT
jgi:hypothetical protein